MQLIPFTDSVLDIAESIEINDEFLEGRPKVSGYTIDDFMSKDLDDGINFFKKDDNYLLQVSISDVASIVKPNTELFSTALNRVETRYLRDFNKPMLPKALSEFKLSLLPKGLRPAITFDIEIKPNGEVCNFEFRETAFRNIAKLSYIEFDDIAINLIDDPAHRLFKEMSKFALFLMERRRTRGALAIYDLIKGIYTTEEGIILPLRKEQAHISNIVIQEFMILTNKTLAWFFANKDIPLLYRNHTAKQSAPTRKEILQQIDIALSNSKYLDSLRQRSGLWFNKAFYSPKIEGHFGLNEPVYTHVTSPIRRVADLINQHIIKAYIHGTTMPYEFERLTDMAEKITLVSWAIKGDRSNIFKEEAREQANILLNYSTKEEFIKMQSPEFVPVLKESAKRNLLLENIEQALNLKFEKKKVDLQMLYVILFKPPSKSAEWLEFKKKAVLYLNNRKGWPLQLLNILKQKGIIENFELDFKTVPNGFLAKINGLASGREISNTDYSYGPNKKDASHKAAYYFLNLLLNLQIEIHPNEETPKDSEECNSDSLFENPVKETEKQIELEETENLENDEYVDVVAQDECVEFIEDENNIEANENNIKEKRTAQIKNDLLLKVKTFLEEGCKSTDYLSEEIIKPAEQKIRKEQNTTMITDDNYIGLLQELCSKNKNCGMPEYKFTVSGLSHSPVITCYGTLALPDEIISQQAEADTKKAAKQRVSQKILRAIKETNMETKDRITELKELKTDNFVGKLQNLCVKLKLPQPDYQFKQIGSGNQMSFECNLTFIIKKQVFEFIGYGQTKKTAKQSAAEKSLQVFH